MPNINIRLHPTPPRWLNRHPFFLPEADPGADAGDAATLDPDLLLVSMPHTTLDHIPVGGRLRYFTHAWSAITADAWILNSVEGFVIDILTPPLLNIIPPPFSSQNETGFL